jgi:hypothetical protein
MTSATTTPAKGTRRRTGEGFGLIIFACVLLLTVGFFNVIDGLVAITRSHVFLANAHYVIGDLRAWGWTTLILGILQIVAAGGLVVGNQIARWCGVGFIALNAIAQMFVIPGYPVWSLLIIAGDALALWGLCAYGGRRNIEAAT